MKILTGRFKDAQIPFKPQPGLRPTPDRVRKAVIDSLSPGWEGARILDLYAGTGAMGLEALSAGAESVLFVEADRKRAAQIEQTIASLESAVRTRRNREDREEIFSSQVIAEKVAEALPRIARSGERFDRVWSDPPYEKGLALQSLDFFKTGQSLNPGAWVIIETYKKEKMPAEAGRLQSRRVAFYGDTAIHYYILV